MGNVLYSLGTRAGTGLGLSSKARAWRKARSK